MLEKQICVALTLALLTFGCSPADRQEAKDTVDKKVETAQNAVEDGVSSGKIKSALIVTPKLDASNINVDTDGSTVYLRGSVINQEQKSLANRLATDMADKGQNVVDELKIDAHPKRTQPKIPTPAP